MTEERIVTSVEVREIIGDMAYVSKENLELCKENSVTLFAKTNSAVAAAAATPLDEGFILNKDAGLMQCPSGELAMRVEKRPAKNGNTYLKYMSSMVTCRKCPLRERCRVGKSKARCYSITQPSEKNRARLDFENSEAKILQVYTVDKNIFSTSPVEYSLTSTPILYIPH